VQNKANRLDCGFGIADCGLRAEAALAAAAVTRLDGVRNKANFGSVPAGRKGHVVQTKPTPRRGLHSNLGAGGDAHPTAPNKAKLGGDAVFGKDGRSARSDLRGAREPKPIAEGYRGASSWGGRKCRLILDLGDLLQVISDDADNFIIDRSDCR